MKAIIVIYIPLEFAPKGKEEERKCKKSFTESIPAGTDVLLINDPTRKKSKVEVFFNPNCL